RHWSFHMGLPDPRKLTCAAASVCSQGRGARIGRMMENRNLAILLSGRGSNFLAIHDAIRRGDLNASICCVISNIEHAPALARARALGLNGMFLPSKGVGRLEYDRLLLETLRPYNPAVILLASFRG